MTHQSLIVEKWLSIAQQNPWIRQRGSGDANDTCAFEEALSEQDFFQCNTVVELYSFLVRGNWMLGQPFYFKNLCFINQINAGDEWLVIRDGIAFEIQINNQVDGTAVLLRSTIKGYDYRNSHLEKQKTQLKATCELIWKYSRVRSYYRKKNGKKFYPLKLNFF